jgi:hypothetical protein
MPKKTLSFADAAAMARDWDGVEETTYYGTPALKVRGEWFTCVPTNKDAEPQSLVVRIDIPGRDELVDADPDTYYVPDHYKAYPSVLVRMTRVHRDAFRDLLHQAWRLAAARPQRRRPARKPVQRASRR